MRWKKKMDERSQSKKFAVYKPNKRATGAAIRFDLNVARESVFLEAAAQSSEQAFDWENKIVFKLGVSDIGKLLSVLEGKVKNIHIYHEPGKSPFALDKSVKNNALGVSKTDFGFIFKVSQQTLDKRVRLVSVPFSEDEAILLKILLQQSVAKIFGWD